MTSVAGATKLLGAALLAGLVLAGCGSRGDDEGNAKHCPNRNAYCPAPGVGVSFPSRPALSPSGEFRLEVFRADPTAERGDWAFRVVDVHSAAVVLAPGKPAMEGGLGIVVAWDPKAPNSVWVTRPEIARWSPDSSGAGTWTRHVPLPGEKLPAVVVATRDSDID